MILIKKVKWWWRTRILETPPQSEWWKRLSWSNCVRVTDSSEAKLCSSRFWNPVTPSCPGSRGGTHHKVSRMWEVIENSAGGAAGIEHRGSICSTKWFKHNTQGVRDTMLACDDSTKGAAGGKLSWTNWEIVHVSRRLGQGDGARRGGGEEEGWWLVVPVASVREQL